MAYKVTTTGQTTFTAKVSTTGQTTFVKKIEVGTPIKSVQQAASGAINSEGKVTGNILVVDSGTSLYMPADILGGNGITVSHDVSTNDITISQDSTYDAVFDDITVTGNVIGNLIPSADSTYTLGTSALKWKELFVSGGSIHLGDIVLSDSGGKLSVTTSGGAAAQTTDDVTEGSTNLYYTDARSNSAIDTRVTGTFVSNLSGVDADTVGSYTPAQLLDYQNFTGTPTIPALYSDFVDSNQVSNIITADVDANFINALTIDADTLGGQNSAYHLNYANFTGTPTIPSLGTDFVDSNQVSSIVSADVDAAFINALNVDADTLDNQDGTYYLNYNNFTSTPSIPTLGTDFVDSASVSTIISADVDTAFVNALNIDANNLNGQDASYYLNYNNFTSTPTIPTFGTNFVDSAFVNTTIPATVDSDYVQQRQAAAASTLTVQNEGVSLTTKASTVNFVGAGVNATGAGATKTITITQGIDSAATIGIIDSDYVLARSSAGIDSAATTSIVEATVDSDYIATRIGGPFIDSDYFDTNIPKFGTDYVDSAYVTSVLPTFGTDFVDSAYVTSVAPTFGTDFVDSAYVTSVLPTFGTDFVDSAYVTSVLPTFGTDFVDSSAVSTIITSDVDAAFINALTIDADTLGNQNSAYHLNYNNFTNTPTIPTLGTDFVDSDQVTTIIDSAYIQLRDTPQDFSYASLTNVPDLLDSSDALGLIDSAYIKVRAQTPDYFDFSGQKPGHAEGRLFYDSANGALAMYNDEADITLQIGQESYVRVYNNSGSTINNGTPVYITGSNAGYPTIGVADASDAAKYEVVGVATHNIENSSFGYATTRGFVNDLDTSNLTVGNRVHLGFASPGTLIEAAPDYPNFPVDIGTALIVDSSAGSIYVSIVDHAAETFRSTGNVRFDGDLTIGGNLNVLGTEVITAIANLEVADNFVKVGVGDTIVTSFTGTGLNDATYKQQYQGDSSVDYFVRIKSTDAGGDIIEWAFDSDFSTILGFDSAGGPTEHDLGDDNTLIALRDNIAITFTATTGHTTGDRWFGAAAQQNEQLGLVGNYNTPSDPYSHAGVFRDTADGRFKFFEGYTPAITTSINTAHASYADANIQFSNGYGNITGNVTGNVTGTVSDISNHDTDNLSEGSTNQYHTTARVEAIVDSDYIATRIGGPFIDSNYFDTNVPKFGTDYVDSASVSTIITSDVDAAFINALTIDADTLGNQNSAYHLNYNNFTNTPTIPSLGTDFVDSSEVSDIITADVDAAFINALTIDADTLGNQNSAYHLAYANFTGTPTIPSFGTDYVDSAYVTSVLPTFGTDFVDSAYVTSQVPTFGTDFVDSSAVSSIITSDVDAAFINALTIDADTLGNQNSAYHLNYNNFTNTPTIPTLGTDFIDSAQASAIITSDVDAAFINALTIDADTLGNQNSAYHLNYDNFTNTPTIPTLGTDFVDSAEVSSIITSDVTATFINNLTIDADTLGNQNSAYHLNYNNFTNTPTIPTLGTDFVDSGEVSDIITADVDAAFINALTIDADTLGNQNSAYHLNYANFTGTPTIPTLGTDFVDSAQASAIITADVDQAFVNALNVDADTLDNQDGTYYLNYNNFSNTPTIPALGTDYVDSSQVLTLIDSDYVGARASASFEIQFFNRAGSVASDENTLLTTHTLNGELSVDHEITLLLQDSSEVTIIL